MERFYEVVVHPQTLEVCMELRDGVPAEDNVPDDAGFISTSMGGADGQVTIWASFSALSELLLKKHARNIMRLLPRRPARGEEGVLLSFSEGAWHAEIQSQDYLCKRSQGISATYDHVFVYVEEADVQRYLQSIAAATIAAKTTAH